MPRATARVCNDPGCPVIIRKGNRCPAHQRARDAHQRATTPTKVTRTAADVNAAQRSSASTVNNLATGARATKSPHAPVTESEHRTVHSASSACRANSRKGARVIQGHDITIRVFE
ncbi:hypothetical protein GS493_05625 [Rhodococcus hoagii]|nr:hypothetical protein [Prescottella equi]NKS73155.1 hypothetical protein [Prescottella equi]